MASSTVTAALTAYPSTAACCTSEDVSTILTFADGLVLARLTGGEVLARYSSHRCPQRYLPGWAALWYLAPSTDGYKILGGYRKVDDFEVYMLAIGALLAHEGCP